MTRSVLLFGAYGQNNVGDDALLEVFLHHFRDDRVVVNSAQPEATARRYGIKAVPTYLRIPRFARIASLLRADLLIFGGGSLLKEIEGHAAARLAYFVRILGVLCVAKLAGCRIAMVGVGMGPLHARPYRLLARVCANLTNVITVRDEPSRRLLKEIGVRTPVVLTADPVFTLAPVPVAERPFGETPTIAFIPRYSLTAQERSELAAACDALVDRIGVRIRFVVFQTGFRPEFDDHECARDIRGRMHRSEAADIVVPERVNETMALLGAVDMVVSARLHGLIFASIQGIASVAIGYDMKVRSFMQSLGRNDACLSLEGVRDGALGATVVGEWPQRHQIAAMISERVDEISLNAARNFDLLLATSFTKQESPPVSETPSPA